MPLVEQAIFAFNEADGRAGYRIVARSPGVCETDARELAAWAPSHDSLLDVDAEAESLNFHGLPSGAYCVSRSTTAGQPLHGGRPCVHTHCLIVPPEVLARFGNNPFALAHAAASRDLWRTTGPTVPALDAIAWPGGAAAVDQAILTALAADPGPARLAALTQAARDTLCLAVCGGAATASAMAGLFSCLPTECRTEFSFSTGMKFSPRRLFHMVAISDDPAEHRWIAQYPNVVVFDWRRAENPTPLDGWSQWVQRAIEAGRIPLLAAEISKRRFQLTLDDLPALGLQLQEELDAVEFHGSLHKKTPPADDSAAARHAHAAHRRFTKSGGMAEAGTAAAASTCIAAASPEILEKLERLDDLVYSAISGQPDSLEQLQVAWPALCRELDEGLLAQSREQYLRYAMTIWEEYAEADAVRRPSQVVQALDVLCLLFDDAA